MYVTKEQIRQARRVNLADYLLAEHPADVKIVGTSLCLKKNPSLYVKRSIPGYHDFSTGEHGNSIDFLTRHLNCSFTDAVNILCGFTGFPRDKTTVTRTAFHLPKKADPPFDRIFTYLTGRGIPPETVMFLIREHLLYQDTPYGNAVFVSPDEDYCEIRGTGSCPFHGCQKKKTDRFWYVMTDSKPKTAYVCEAAIDAVSLMLIHQAQGMNDPAVYVSIGGVANQRTIDRISKRIPVVLAVDNDPSGDSCRKRNPGLPILIPSNKDWNDDLRKMIFP